MWFFIFVATKNQEKYKSVKIKTDKWRKMVIKSGSACLNLIVVVVFVGGEFKIFYMCAYG